jgi:hypothetical protein
LGDWHGFLTVGDRTAYSGTPEVDRFGRDEPGGCIVVEARSGEAPELRRVETGRYRWLSRQWNMERMEDLDREIAALRSEARLSDVLLSLGLSGVVSLADRVGMTSAIKDGLAHELRHLDLDTEGLTVRPTTEDIAGSTCRARWPGRLPRCRPRRPGRVLTRSSPLLRWSASMSRRCGTTRRPPDDHQVSRTRELPQVPRPAPDRRLH